MTNTRNKKIKLRYNDSSPCTIVPPFFSRRTTHTYVNAAKLPKGKLLTFIFVSVGTGKAIIKNLSAHFVHWQTRGGL